MAAARKLLLIMWKNWITRKHHFIMTALEIIIPTLFTIVLVVIRVNAGSNSQVEYINKSETYEQHDILRQSRPRMPSCFHSSDDEDENRCNNPQILMYTRENNITRSLMECIKKYSSLFTYNCLILKSLPDEKSMEDYAIDFRTKNTTANLWGGVSFVEIPDSLSSLNKMHYRIRPYIRQYYNVWNTEYLLPPFRSPGPPSDQYYKYNDFLSLQHLIAMFYMEKYGSLDITSFVATTQQLPYPPYYRDSGFGQMVSITLPLFICLSYIFIAPTLIKRVVAEKERGIKELMKMMGLHGWIQWLGWFLNSFIMMGFSAIIIVVLLCVPFETKAAVLNLSSPSVIFVTFLLYIAASIAFCFFISTFFSKPSVATAVGCIIWLLTFMAPFFPLQDKIASISFSAKMSLCLLPNMAMALAIRNIAAFESRDIGLQWSSLASSGIMEDNVTMLHYWGMMVLDLLLYLLLTWYMDNVFPGVYGIGKPWYFLFTRSYWCGHNKNETIGHFEEIKSSKNFEKEPTGLSPAVIVKNLSKAFTGDSYVVNDVSINIYNGQITALLGHNGAGKTTTMSILTGMIPPTLGTAYIEGHDIATETDRARQSIGLCPQHNMLFDILTVKEHLVFFGKLKGLKSSELENDVDSLMNKLQLAEKKNVATASLSGGMKRKLNLGIALVGGTKVVMLDEPTSGMDPEARRAIWDLLQEFRRDRCILLTTHYMEEADILGDRIAIMDHGKIQCCGSTMFLKRRFGAGYHLNINKNETCDVTKLANVIQRYLPNAHLDSNVSTELSFILPTEATNTFPQLFQDLETNKEKYGINSLGVSVTTMEEVFLKVGEMDLNLNSDNDSYEDMDNEKINLTNVSHDVTNLNFNSGLKLQLQRFRGLLLKRWHYGYRRWSIIIAQILVPSLIAISVVLINNAIDFVTPMEPSRTMDISQYGETIPLMNNNSAGSIGQYYPDVFPSGTNVKIVSNISDFVIEEAKRSLSTYNNKFIVAVELNSSSNGMYINSMFNGIYYHTSPLALNLIHNTILKSITAGSDSKIIVENAPLPKDPNEVFEFGMQEKNFKSIIMGLFIPIGLSVMSASLVIFPIHERLTQAKHLQLMTGVGGVLFWGSSFLWDFFLHIVSCSLMCLFFGTIDKSHLLTGDGQMGIVFLVLLIYGWAAIPFSYTFSFLSKSPASGFNRITLLNLLTGILMSMMIFFFKMVGSDNLKTAGKVLQWIARFFPIYGVTAGFMQITSIGQQNSYCDNIPNLEWQCSQPSTVYIKCCKDICGDSCFQKTSYITWNDPGIGQEIMMLMIDGFVYFAFIFLIERGLFYKFWYLTCAAAKRIKINSVTVTNTVEMDDSDVIAENERVNFVARSGSSSADALLIHNLSKHFWDFIAVDNLNFGVKFSECFGLLGVNGAGKTTTFQMLTGNATVTSGNAYIQALSLKNNRSEFLERISYCPQFDALIEYLTGREMLSLFARLRGIDEIQIGGEINKTIETFDLTEHADKITKAYSGGNKRKLSAAIAFLGNRPLVFLDEPTTGVDPVARRKLWNILLATRNAGFSIILTSHSMEECEVLCSRLAIMVNGKFQCLGSCQYLKNKFGEGFTIIAKLRPSEDQDVVQNNLKQFIQYKFPNCYLKDVHQGVIHYQVTDRRVTWQYVFQVMEEAKSTFNLEDYSVSQTTLEQIFLSFARKQRIMETEGKEKNRL